jgi:hypothetical protein
MALKPATPAPITSTLHGGIYDKVSYRQNGRLPTVYLSSRRDLTSEKATKGVRSFQDSLVSGNIRH